MPEVQESVWLLKTNTNVMTVQQAADNFGKVAKDLQSNHNGEIMAKLGISALTFIKERVIEKGINAKGAKFAPYSTKPMLVGCKSFIKKSVCETLLGSKPKRKKLEWRTVNEHRLAILPGGYKKLRELQGRQADHVDFSMTNDMWNDVNVVSKPSDHKNGVAIISTKKESEQKKLAGNTKRRGDILDLSTKEIDDLKLTYNLDVLQIFRINGL